MEVNVRAGSAEQAIIGRSWERCAALGLHRDDCPCSEPHGADTLREARDRAADLLLWSQADLNLLSQAMERAKGIAVLADSTGYILDARGDVSFLDRAQRVALLPGVQWSEAREGTNAIGTALAEGTLVEVVGDEHYLDANRELTCTAMPILNPESQVVGVIDITSHAQAPHREARNLVQLAVTSIEHRWALHYARPGDLVLRLHSHPAWLHSPQEGIVVLRDGQIVASNRLARQHLQQLGTDALHKLQQLPLDRAVTTESLDLPGLPLYAHATQPLGASTRSTPPSAPPLPGVHIADGYLWDTATTALATAASRALDAGLPVLIHGESGSGKAHFVRALHRRCSRAAAPLIAIHCATLQHHPRHHTFFGPDTLGKASGGLLFLDDVGELPLPLQAQLLHSLQGAEGHTPGVSVIATSQQDLATQVETGRFRQDLYYHLRSLPLLLPPLRERADLPALLDLALDFLGAKQRDVALSPRAREQLLTYRWPGNFRELMGALQTVLALTEDHTTLTVEHFALQLDTPLHRPSQPAPPTLQSSEADLIRKALEASGGNISAAARQLGIHRTTLHRKLKRSDSTA